MMIKRLQDIAEITSGFAFKSKEFRDESTKGYPIIRIQNLNQTNTDFKYWALEFDDKYVVNKGDLLLSLSGNVKLDRWSGPVGLLNQRIVKVLPKKEVLKEWLYYFLESIVNEISSLMKKSIIGNISITDIRNIKVDVPPINEQERVIEKLKKSELILDKRQQQIEALSALKQSVFLDMFGDPLTNNKKWIISKGDEVLNIKGGYAFKSGDYKSDGFPVIRIGNVNSGEFRDENFKFIPVNIEEYKRFLVKPGDLLISMTGTVGKEDYGNVSMVTNKYDTYLLNQRVGNIDVKNNMNKLFVFYLFKNNHFKRQLTKLSRGVRQANISNKDIYSLDIITPPLNLQKEFENKVKEIDATILSTKYSLEELKKLYESLLQKTFNGELFKDEVKS